MLNYVLIGYMWLFIHRPFEFWTKLGDLHVERIYMIFAILIWALSGRIRWPSNLIHIAYLVFGACVLLSWVASPWATRGFCQTEVENYVKLLVFYFMLVTTVWTQKDLEIVVLGFLFSLGLYMAHSYMEYRAGRHKYAMETYRMVGVDDSLGDPNSFSASILYSLPFLFPAWTVLRRYQKWGKLALGAYVGLSLLCITLTGSRGAFIGIIVLALILGLRSPYRFRLLTAMVLMSPLGWFALPENLKERFRTIVDKNAGPANAHVSADSRSEGFWIGLELLQQRPLTGTGPGAWRPATGRHIESHNLYGQVTGEMGLLGLLSFGTIIVLLFRNIRAIKQPYRTYRWPRDFLYHLADAIWLSILLLLLLGFASHSLFRYNWLWYGAFLIVARHCVEHRLIARPLGQVNGIGLLPRF